MNAAQGLTPPASVATGASALHRYFMHRQHGNRFWGSGITPHQPAAMCEFEMFTQQLGLSEHEYSSSLHLRTWCDEHKNRCYIPEWLLKRWNMRVDTEVGEVARPTVMRRDPLT